METSDSSEDVGFDRYTFTITEYHNELLDEIVSYRYPNRSHAVRVAIGDLHQSVTTDDEQKLQDLEDEVEDMGSSVDELEQKVSQIHSVVCPPTHQGKGWDGETASGKNGDYSPADSEINKRVYDAISDDPPLSLGEIVENSGIQMSRVQESVEELIEQGLVSIEAGEYGALYRPSPPADTQ
ncbi:helix-turn-helix domain-containing protein [Halobacterium rubrum]|uniref:helix-turn-helix domain-containing protein n=1 Tax=Halobacterium TaxID=2239 RepID=UPI001F20E0E4|nr:MULTISPECIES: helix-turn-helix domain-containing protein [Halobacterium]MDH5020365.1 helix-turn-helix domain-containing protein [Halobacterium rubrum]